MSASVVPPDLVVALQAARHVVVLTGAGVSAESGIATFRDPLTGLWSRFDPMQLATPEAFVADPALVWGFYEWRRAAALRARPNPGHLAIASLAGQVPRLTLVTQNVDDLHERAGSAAPVRLHGSLHQARCFDCGLPHPFQPEPPDEPAEGRRLAPPHCAACGGLVRPGVVWFGESLPVAALAAAQAAARSADLLLVVGTSGQVYPAAELPRLAQRCGARVAVVNLGAVASLDAADWWLDGPSGVLLPALVEAAFGPHGSRM